MIALISFQKSMILERQEAVKLNLLFTEVNYEIVLHDGELNQKTSSYILRSDIFKDNEGKEWKDKEMTIELGWCYKCEKAKDLDYVSVKQDGHLVDLEWFAINCPYKFFIEKSIKTNEPTVQNIQSLLNQVEEKMNSIDKTIDIMTQQTFNQKCDVHVGGGLIVTYNDLLLAQDCCTDELQYKLNDGWRIIAVCNQPDQRRPDYVLGRYDSNRDSSKQSAKRK